MPVAISHEPVVQAGADFLPLKGMDFVEFYVGNARQAAHYYRSAFGMRLTGYCGPETGVRDRAHGWSGVGGLLVPVVLALLACSVLYSAPLA